MVTSALTGNDSNRYDQKMHLFAFGIDGKIKVKRQDKYFWKWPHFGWLQTEADLGRKVRGSKLGANSTLAKLDP